MPIPASPMNSAAFRGGPLSQRPRLPAGPPMLGGGLMPFQPMPGGMPAAMPMMPPQPMPGGDTLAGRASASDGAVRGGALSGRGAVPVGRPMSAQRRLDMLARRAWTNGDMNQVRDLAQSQVYRDLWNQPRGGAGMPAMPAMPQPMPAAPTAPAGTFVPGVSAGSQVWQPAAPPAPAMPMMPDAAPAPAAAPLPAPAPLPMNGETMAQVPFQSAPLYPQPPAALPAPAGVPNALPPSVLNTPLPGLSTQPPPQPRVTRLDVPGPDGKPLGWVGYDTQTGKGVGLSGNYPGPAEIPLPILTNEQQRRIAEAGYRHTGKFEADRMTPILEPLPNYGVDALGKVQEYPAGYELPEGVKPLKRLPTGGAPAAPAPAAPAGGAMSGKTSKGYTWSFSEPKI